MLTLEHRRKCIVQLPDTCLCLAKLPKPRRVVDMYLSNIRLLGSTRGLDQCVSGFKSSLELLMHRTSKTQVTESFVAPLEVVINFEALVILGQCPELAKEGEILPRILENHQ